MRIVRWVVGICALVLLAIGTASAQGGIRAVVVNEFQNVRVSPAIGATVIDTVNAGFVFETFTGRSGDGQWLRVEHQCSEGWVHIVPLVVLQGDPNSLPVADPRSIPFGGFDAPRAGFSPQQGSVSAAATDGLRVRAGPSRAYPTLANINFNQAFTITGRNNCGTWYQVNFENTLGWVSSAFVRIIGGDVTVVPVGGIVAESAPVSGEAREDYLATLRLMLDRLNIAQQSLDSIRASWTDAALSGRAVCQEYPPRPSAFQIATPLLAAFFDPLNSLVNDFNDAMFNTRQVVDLFIEVCNQPGTANPVGQATVQGALDIINLAEQQYASLRQRLLELIPSLEAGPNECLLTYNRKSEVIPRINLNTIYLDSFTRRTIARGYCFDALEFQVLDIQTLPIPPSELEIFVSLSPMDDPANFLLVARSPAGLRQIVGPVVLPRTATYLVLMADLGSTEGDNRLPFGDYAFKVSDLTFDPTASQIIAWDDATNSVILEQSAAAQFQQQQTTTSTVPVVCPSLAFTCDNFFTCDEARACYNAGNFSLDADGDGLPCEATVCLGQ